jgi:hypothetical protein
MLSSSWEVRLDPSNTKDWIVSPLLKVEEYEVGEAAGLGYVRFENGRGMAAPNGECNDWVMSKSSGRALDFIIRSRSSLVRRFNLARLTIVSGVS